MNENNPQNTAAARLSESMDLSAPDRVDDQFYNRIPWLMLKGDVPPPVARSHAALQILAIGQIIGQIIIMIINHDNDAGNRAR